MIAHLERSPADGACVADYLDDKTVAPEHLIPRGRLATRLEDMRDVDTEAATAFERWSASDYSKPSDAARIRVRWRHRVLGMIVGSDALLAFVAGLLAVWILGGAPAGTAVWVSIVGACGWVSALSLARVYEQRSLGHGSEEFRRLFTATITSVAVFSTAALAGGQVPGADADVLRHLAVGALPLAGVFSAGGHVGARIVLRGMRRRGRCRHRVVVVGLERSVHEIVRATRRDSAAGLTVVGACLTRSRADDVDGVPVLGSPGDAVRVVRALDADTLLLTAWSDVSQEELRRLSWELEGSGVQLLVAPRLSGVAVPRLHIRTVDGAPLVQVDEQEFTGGRRVAKAALDYGLSGLLLLLLSPVLVAVAIAVKATSPGPILFRQERVGRFGETFHMHKFRSMFVDAEARRDTLAADDGVDRGPLFKMRDDPRVTRVGVFIRRYSLDELPQLLDVFLGRMSLVGPRPPLPAEVAQYEDDVRRRLRVKPGMTGLWQVSGRSNLPWEEAVRLDLQYVEGWSLTADLAIMGRTVAAVLARDGAY